MSMSHLNLLKKKNTKEGFCKKNPSAKGKDEVRSGWKERYFVLQGRTLKYFKSPENVRKAQGEIDLRAARIDPADAKTGKLYTVRIAQAKQVFSYLQMANLDEQNDWILHLRKAAGYSAAESEEATIRLLYQDFKSSLCSFSALQRPSVNSIPERVVLLFDAFHGGHMKVIKDQQVIFSFNAVDVVRCFQNDRPNTTLSLVNAAGQSLKLITLDVECKADTGLTNLRFYLLTEQIVNYVMCIINAFRVGNLEPVRTCCKQSTVQSDYVRMGDGKARDLDLAQKYFILTDYNMLIMKQSNSLIPFMVVNLHETSLQPHDGEYLIINTGLELVKWKMQSEQARDAFMLAFSDCTNMLKTEMAKLIRALGDNTKKPKPKKKKVTVVANDDDDDIPPPPPPEGIGHRDSQWSGPSAAPPPEPANREDMKIVLPYVHPLPIEDSETDTFLLAWGNGSDGQLANKVTESLVPMNIKSLQKKKIRSLSAGLTHVCAVTPNGHLFVWGYGPKGQLGLGSRNKAPNPFLCTNLMKEGPIALVACGDDHTLAVTRKGVVFAWGDNEFGQCAQEPLQFKTLDKPQEITALKNLPSHYIAAGATHSACISGSDVFLWGSNHHGALGRGDSELPFSPTPKPVNYQADVKVAAVSCGENFTATIDSTGAVHTWGSNDHGKLGIHDDSDYHTNPQLVQAFDSMGYVINMITLGSHHAVALATNTAKGAVEVLSWGQGIRNAAMSDQKQPVLLPALTGIRYVSASTSHTVAISEKGRVFAFGVNKYGELGNGVAHVQALVKAKIKKSITVIGATLGEHFTIAICKGECPELVTAVKPVKEKKSTRGEDQVSEETANAHISNLFAQFSIKNDQQKPAVSAEANAILSAEQTHKLLSQLDASTPTLNSRATAMKQQAPVLPTTSAPKAVKKKKKVLPPGWRTIYDPTHERNYYYHDETKTSSWKRPKK